MAALSAFPKMPSVCAYNALDLVVDQLSRGAAKSRKVVGLNQGWLNPQQVTLFNHLPGGCNVVFLEGHVEFRK
jgi:hypothetical protein